MDSQSWVLPEELHHLAESGEQELVKEVLAVFQTDTAERLAAVKLALQSNDRVIVRNQAHAVKGSASQVGAVRVAAICQSIELDALTAEMSDLVERVGQVESEFAEVCRAMGS